ncbi:MAG: LamG domain-containing protein [Candidatus Poribacteria bacterium]
MQGLLIDGFRFAGVAVAALLVAGVASAQFVTDGLVGYWSLDASTISGDTVQDVWGDSDGVINGALESATGRVGGALEFDGVSEIEIDGTDALNLNGLDSFSVVAWANAASDAPVEGAVPGLCCGSIVAQRDVNGWALRYDAREVGTEYEFIVNTGSWQGDGAFGAPQFPAGEWHHLAGVLDAGTMAIYLDGALLMELPDAGALSSEGSELDIGHAGDGGFVGLIDEVGVYNRALSADEVATNFSVGGLVAVEPAGKLATRWASIKQDR